MTTVDYRPQTLDIDVRRGDDLTIPLTFTTDGTTPIDISTWTLTAEVRTSFDDANPLASFTIAVTNAATGQATISLAAADLALMHGKYVWDLQRSITGSGARTDPNCQWFSGFAGGVDPNIQLGDVGKTVHGPGWLGTEIIQTLNAGSDFSTDVAPTQDGTGALVIGTATAPLIRTLIAGSLKVDADVTR
jgi:hypothetical protein